MKINKGILILTLLLFIIILGFNSVSASDSSDLLEDTSDLGIEAISTSVDDDISGYEAVELDSSSDSSSDIISDIPNSDLAEDSNTNSINEDSNSDSLNEDSPSDSVYVSRSGNDDNDGSKESPVRTVERGIQLATNETGSHKVFVMEGTFEVFDIDINRTFVTIEGSGIDKTIFDGIGYTGGMFLNYESNFTIKNLSIIDAANTGESGGAFTNIGNLTIENLKVSNCIVKNFNGAVIYSVGGLNIINSSFINNKVTNPTDTAGNGGVIYINGYNTPMTYPPNLNISGCEFRDNLAEGNQLGGGAIFMQYADGFKSIENSRFINNRALAGGAIFLQDSEGKFIINNVSFIRNKAIGNTTNYGGGAINLVGQKWSTVGNVIISNSVFVNNSAINTRGGGAILNRNVNLNLSNSIIYNNNDNKRNLSIFKDTIEGSPANPKIILEDNWWGTNSPSKLDKITIKRWVVLNLSAELIRDSNGDLRDDAKDILSNLDNADSSKLNCYDIKVLLNQYNDGTLIENPDYYPFDAEFYIVSNNGELNQSAQGKLENNVANILLSSPTKDNVITVTLNAQTLQFNTSNIISNISADKLQEFIDNANDGDTIDLSNYNCENISNVNITKSLNFIGNSNTLIKSAGEGAIFVVDQTKNPIDSLNISGIKFLVDNGDTVLSVNAANSTNPLEIDIPAINISDISVDKINDDVVGQSVNLLQLNSERGLLATNNPISIQNNQFLEGIKGFKFTVNGIEDENGVVIPKGGSIDTNGSSDKPIVKLATKIIAKGMKTTTVNTKINGKKAGKTYSISLKDSKGKALANKQVLISFNGKVYKRTTNAKGVASVKVALSKKGTYPVVVTFLGDDKYNGSFAVAKVKVNPQKVKLTVAKKKYKASKKTKILKATLKAANKKAIKGKKLVFIVNKKKYTAKTNKKGVAKVKVKLSRKKTYKVKVKFAGDSTFKKISKKGKLVIK